MMIHDELIIAAFHGVAINVAAADDLKQLKQALVDLSEVVLNEPSPKFNRTIYPGVSRFLVLIGILAPSGEMFMATGTPGDYISLDNPARRLRYESASDVSEELPVGWRILTIDYGTYPGPDAYRHVRISAARAEETPPWFVAWQSAMGDAIKEGQSLSDAARGLARSPKVFGAQDTVLARSQRWFLINEELQRIQVCYKNPTYGWLQWTVTVDNEKKRLVVSRPDRWSTADRESLERLLLAHANRLHGTKVWTPDMSALAVYRGILQVKLGKEFSADSEKVIETIDQVGTLTSNPASKSRDAIATTRIVEMTVLPLWKGVLQTIIPTLQELHGTSSALLLNELGKDISHLIDHLIEFYETMKILLSGNAPEALTKVADALKPLEDHFAKGWAANPSLSGTWDVPDDVMQTHFRGTAAMLGLLMDNLIGNAKNWAAEPTSGQRPDIQMTGRREWSEVVLTVRDNGPGGADPMAWKDPLLGGSRRNGEGVGLPTIYYLAKALGAKIHVDSPAGQGTTVSVRLPVSDPALPRTHRDSPLTQELWDANEGQMEIFKNLLQEVLGPMDMAQRVIADLRFGPFLENLDALDRLFPGARTILGVDLVAQNVEKARDGLPMRYPDLAHRVHLYQADVRHMPFIETGSVALAVAIGVTLPGESADEIDDMIRILAPGGILYAVIDALHENIAMAWENKLRMSGDLLSSHFRFTPSFIFRKSLDQAA